MGHCEPALAGHGGELWWQQHGTFDRPPCQLAASATSSKVCRKTPAHCRVPPTSTSSQLVLPNPLSAPLTRRLSTVSVFGPVTRASTSTLSAWQRLASSLSAITWPSLHLRPRESEKMGAHFQAAAWMEWANASGAQVARAEDVAVWIGQRPAVEVVRNLDVAAHTGRALDVERRVRLHQRVLGSIPFYRRLQLEQRRRLCRHARRERVSRNARRERTNARARARVCMVGWGGSPPTSSSLEESALPHSAAVGSIPARPFLGCALTCPLPLACK